MRTHCLLDGRGDNPVPSGYTLVEDEVTLLRELVEGKQLHVRGKDLCQWAADLCQARGWDYEHLGSPLTELRQYCPGLTEAQARGILKRLDPLLANLPRPLSPKTVATALWPELFGESEPSPGHAARWLLWVIEKPLGDEDRLLANAAAEGWQAASSGLERAYAVATTEEAWKALMEWLRVADSPVEWPAFPLAPLPPWLLRRLREEWSVRAVSTRGSFVSEILGRRPSRELLGIAAEAAARYYMNHPEDVTYDKLQTIISYLPADIALELQRSIPPEDPGDPPDEVEDALQWFTQRYLPFRLWSAQFGFQAHQDRVRETAGKFALWYVSLYAKARVGGAGAERLSWSKAAHLGQEGANYVTLLVVFDGLAYPDAEELLDFTRTSCQRLALDYREVVLAPLPTTTQFAKRALLTGVRPAQALEEEKLGPLETRYPDVLSALKHAVPGSLVIWSILEPDRTYHGNLDEVTTREEARTRLQGLALRIVKLVNEVPAEKKLRVVITTDHGRLLASARRAHQVPDGMESHGRAAWGQLARDFPQEGFIAEGPVAYLHADRFGLPVHCAVLITDEAFLDAQGRRGTEPFAHGGAYPEEVLIPWIQMTRDRIPISLKCTLTGKGVADRDGQLILEVINPGDLPVVITSLHVGEEGLRVPLSLKVEPMATAKVNLSYSPWPKPQVLASTMAKLTYVLPNQEEYSLSLSTDLASEEMYAAIDILDDLGRM